MFPEPRGSTDLLFPLLTNSTPALRVRHRCRCHGPLAPLGAGRLALTAEAQPPFQEGGVAVAALLAVLAAPALAAPALAAPALVGAQALACAAPPLVRAGPAPGFAVPLTAAG